MPAQPAAVQRFEAIFAVLMAADWAGYVIEGDTTIPALQLSWAFG